MSKSLYFRLAGQNLYQNKKFYLPYLLTIIGTVAGFYITCTLAGADDLPNMTRYAYLSTFMVIGCWVIGLFAVIFLFYTNSFLMKRRQKELGLYNILGMGKRHIALMLGIETLYIAVIGLVGGLLGGMLLQKLVTLLIYRLMRFDVPFGFYISGSAIRNSVILFCAILLANLLVNLLRMHMQNPLELMREGSAGEREPKSRWLLAVLGIAALAGGYWISLSVHTAIEAFAFYFLAVLLVIVGTYLLFTAVSIAVLKLLRANKRIYYQTQTFIGISGMLYRMKRNAVGLANICILSTMVMVMVSGTLSLYLGTGDAIKQMYPGDLTVSVRYAPSQDDPFRPDAMLNVLEEQVKKQGLSPALKGTEAYLITEGNWQADGFQVTTSGDLDVIYVVTAAEYGRLTGRDTPPLAADEAMLCAAPQMGGTLRMSFASDTVESPADQIFRVRSQDNPMPSSGKFAQDNLSVLVVADEAALFRIADAQPFLSPSLRWNAYIDTDGSDEQKIACAEAVSDWSAFGENANTGRWDAYLVRSRQQNAIEMYSVNGGFFFLGIFLGILFIMAAVLIIYYKQLSEGYEDRERFQIMQKVGLDQKMIRQSINAQILVVFSLPLIVAAVHVAFDYRLMRMLLTLFSLSNGGLTWMCNLFTFLGFALIYGIVYCVTAREYYKIVR